MNLFFILLTILGLSLFEIITSVDNAVINAEVLSTMKEKYRRIFLFWGIIFAVFVVRGALPFLIVWSTLPTLSPIQVITETFRSSPETSHLIEKSAPILMIGGGTFLIFIFFHWLFLEPKHYGLRHERFFHAQGAWFFVVVSVLLSMIVWFSLTVHPIMAFGAVLGSTVFFIVHGFRQYAEEKEKRLIKGSMSDMSKLIYLEVLDASFSIDGVVGAFAFTFSVPLILLGNGLGALVLRQLTISNIERIKKYKYLKNGAMYSVFFLGIIMILGSFGFHIPPWASPIMAFGTVGYFFYKSKIHLKDLEAALSTSPTRN